MHAHFMLRGIKQDVDLMIKWLETRTFPLTAIDKDGNEKHTYVQSQLRYSIFGTWEFIFPDTHKDLVLTALGFQNPPHPNSKKFKAALNFLRIAMGLKKPTSFKVTPGFMMPNVWCSIIPIGWKEDGKITLKDGLTQEAI